MKVQTVAFAPDGKLLASGGADSTTKLWDVLTGGELRSLVGDGSWVKSLVFSGDGRRLAAGTTNGNLRVWDVATGKPVLAISGHAGPIESVAFSPDNRWLGSGGADRSIKVWDAETGQAAFSLEGHIGWVTSLTFSADGRVLASGSNDRSARLWDLAKKRERQTLAGHTDSITSLAFSPDGKTLATASLDSTIKFWRVSTGAVRQTITGHTKKVLALSFSSDGKWLTSGAADGKIKVWKTVNGQETQTLTSPLNMESVESMSLTRDSKFLAVTSGDRVVEMWEVAPKGEIRTLASHSSPVESVTFSQDGRWFVTGSKDRTVKLWEVATGRELLALAKHNGWVTAVVFSPDGRWVASGSLSGAIKISETATGREVREIVAHNGAVNAIAFNPRVTNQMASVGGDNAIKIWNASTGVEVRSLTGHTGEVTVIAFSPDGRLLASGGTDKTMRVWDVETGRQIYVQENHAAGIQAIAFSPDGKLLATGSKDKTIKVWSASEGRELRTLVGNNDWVTSLTFSPDGNLVASGGRDHTVRLWDASDGREVRAMAGHSGSVNSVAFSPGAGKKFSLLSASEDGSARVWDAESGELRATLMSLRESNEWLVVTPDGLFDGSPSAWKQILWRFAHNTFNVRPVEVFFNEFYSPGVLAEVLAGKKPRAAQDISQKDRRQPQVSLALSAGPAGAYKTFTDRNVRVKIEVAEAPADSEHAGGSGARDVRLFRNGSLVRVWHGDVLPNQASSTVLETTIPLVAGDNRLSAYAFNHDNIKSTDSVISLNGDSSLARPGTVYVLAVGINVYENSQYNLRYAVADAEAFGEELRVAQRAIGGFRQVEVIPLLDSDATKANILLALKRLGEKDEALPSGAPPALARIKPAQPEDVVVIYFSGHGTAQRNQFYLMPHNIGYKGSRTNLDQAGLQTILENSISDRQLEQAVESVDASRLLLVIDACNSGQALEAEEKRRGPMNSKGLAQLAYEKGIYILTAAQGYQAALETSKLGHGYLTYALVEEGLKTASADLAPKDGLVILREWLDYATERVPQMQQELDATQGRGLEQVDLVATPSPAGDKAREEKQRPRVFYRSETEGVPLIIAKPSAGTTRGTGQ